MILKFFPRAHRICPGVQSLPYFSAERGFRVACTADIALGLQFRVMVKVRGIEV